MVGRFNLTTFRYVNWQLDIVKIRVTLLGMKSAYHHGDLEAALTRAAVDQVRAGGLDSLTLRGVSGQVGVSAAAAYHHFHDKDALVASVCAAGSRELAARFEQALLRHPADSPAAVVARFMAIGDAYIQFAIDDPALFGLAFRPLHHYAVATEPDGALAILHACLRDLGTWGLLRDERPDAAALIAWSAVHGYAELLSAGLVSAAQRTTLLGGICDAVLRPVAVE